GIGSALFRVHPSGCTGLRLGFWRSTSVGICVSKAALCAIGRVRASCDTNAVPDRFLQNMRVPVTGQRTTFHQLSLMISPVAPKEGHFRKGLPAFDCRPLSAVNFAQPLRGDPLRPAVLPENHIRT